MITEWLVKVGTSIGSFFGTLFSAWEVPTWMSEPLTAIYPFLDSASGLGVWFAWGTLSAVVASMVVLYGITLVAKLVREIAKHIPFVGGAG